MSKKGGLGGAGLNALLQSAGMNSVEVQKSVEEAEKTGVLEIDVSLIELNPDQPRKIFKDDEIEGLAKSILENGLINPVTLREKDGRYQIISGERRFRALKFLNKTKIPSLVLKNIPDSKMLELTLVENIQRSDLNAIEIARSYKKLIEELNIKQEELANRIGKSRSSISNSMRLLDLSDSIQELVLDGKITEGHARSILSLEDNDDREIMALEIIENNYSVRETERLVKEKKDSKLTNIKTEENTSSIKKENINSTIINKDPNIRRLEDDLEKIFATKVNVVDKNGREGKIVIEYYSSDDLERIMDMLDSIDINKSYREPKLEY